MLYGREGRHLFFKIMGAVFGWIWILSVPINLALFAYAIFGDGRWIYLLFSFFAGSVAKWLGQGFYDNADRIVIESFLMNRGADKDVAMVIWRDCYQQSGRISARQLVNLDDDEIEDLIFRYSI